MGPQLHFLGHGGQVFRARRSCNYLLDFATQQTLSDLNLLVRAGSAQQMVMHGAGFCLANQDKSWRSLERGVGFHVDQAIGRQDLAGGGPDLLQPVFAERRVEQDQVEVCAAVPGKETAGPVADDLHIQGAQLLAYLPELKERPPFGLNQGDLSRSARRGFQAQRAGAGKQIEHAAGRKVAFPQVGQPIEKRLAHAVGRGAQARGVDDRYRRAPVLPANDADLLWSVFLADNSPVRIDGAAWHRRDARMGWVAL